MAEVFAQQNPIQVLSVIFRIIAYQLWIIDANLKYSLSCAKLSPIFLILKQPTSQHQFLTSPMNSLITIFYFMVSCLTESMVRADTRTSMIFPHSRWSHMSWCKYYSLIPPSHAVEGPAHPMLDRFKSHLSSGKLRPSLFFFFYYNVVKKEKCVLLTTWCFLFVSNWKLLDHLCCLEKEGAENGQEHLHLQPGPVGLGPLHLYPLHLAGGAQQAVPLLPVVTGMQVITK